VNEIKGASAVQREPFFDPRQMRGRPGLEPTGVVAGPVALALCEAGQALALAGGPLAFTHMRFGNELLAVADLRRRAEQADMGGDETLALRLEALSCPRAPLAGLALSGRGARTRIMGVCNVTPDSFSDGGDHADPGAAVTFARRMAEAGADIIDVGGESTRPGALPVSHTEELDRVLPVVEALAANGLTVSIDTRHADVMRAAIAAGATIVNDVAALTEPGALEAVAQSNVSVILMHMRGTPETMQARPAYEDVVQDVFDWLADRVQACHIAGISHDRIVIDPGFGFGKTVEHNAALLAQLARFHGLGCALAVGLSRKSFIGAWTSEKDPKARLPGSLAAAISAAARGAQIVRVHDVAQTRAALAVWRKGAGLSV
jgi:dihydropteroate synthase